MTIIGCKKNSNAPKKPWKGATKPRRACKTGSGKAKEDEAFMSQFRGLPDIMNGRTESMFLTDAKGKMLKTEGHHLLPKSVYPEYRHTKENIAVLTRENHSWAEDNPNLFDKWLKENRPEIYEWKRLNQHHRKESV